MPATYSQYNGDGVNRNFAVPFPYIDKAHVQVSVDGVAIETFSWLTGAMIQTATAPASGTLVDVRRVTPTGTLPVDFEDGAALSASQLDTLAAYAAYLAEESKEFADSSMQTNSTGNYDALGRGIVNVAPATAPEGLPNKAQLDAGVSSASTSAASAVASAASALDSKNAAASSAAAALVVAEDPDLRLVADDLGGSIGSYDLGSVDVPATPPISAPAGAIRTVANSIEDVNTVADSIAEVAAVAGSITSVNTAAANLAAINAAPTEATNAANSATAAAGSASAASTSATNAATSLDSFRKQYQGALAANPTTRYDGTSLQNGDLYFNTAAGALRFRSGATWVDIQPGVIPDGTITVDKFAPSLDMGVLT